jgi:methionyl-tRNA formyltransferase
MGSTFEFAIVGRGALATSCAQQILDRGLPVRALVSTDSDVLAWAARHGLPSGSDLRLLGETCLGEGGVLLSVSNDRIIPAQLLDAFPLAINFHDGPLPQYSGSHATSWALMARERSYGITWHRITARADAGEILLEVPVALSSDETAFTLNGKCHQAALSSFPRVLDSIVADSLVGRPQNPARRVFYPRDRRPERCAVLDFRRPASDLDALARGLAYGQYVNRLGLPKFWTGHDFIVVRRIEIKAARSRSAPGTVLCLGAQAIEVATSTHDVRLRDFQSLDGEPLDCEALVARFGVRAGAQLPNGSERLDEAIALGSGCHWRDEEFWVARLRELRPLVLPLAAAAVEPAEIVVGCEPSEPGTFIACVMGWLARITGAARVDIGLEDPVDRGPLVARVRPFGVDVDFNAPCHVLRASASGAYSTWTERGPYLRDAPLRYPSVAVPSGWKDFAAWPVVASFGSGSMDPPASLHICRDMPSGLVRMVSGAGGVPAVALGDMAAQFAALHLAMLSTPHAALGAITLPARTV